MKLDLFYIFPVACLLTVAGIIVLNMARGQALPVGQDSPATS